MAPRKVLLAEDDVDDQNLFFDFLNQRDDIMLMPVAENGVALIDFLENTPREADLPHLIILDQNMPKKNGIETLEYLKEHTRYEHIPIMIYSTYTDDYLIKRSMAKGASWVVPKPVTKEGYNKMIDSFLKSHD
jgi:CheY-like chemotaxis protein